MQGNRNMPAVLNGQVSRLLMAKVHPEAPGQNWTACAASVEVSMGETEDGRCQLFRHCSVQNVTQSHLVGCDGLRLSGWR